MALVTRKKGIVGREVHPLASERRLIYRSAQRDW